MENKTFAIFGDCVSQGIVDNRKHTRALGFINWYSLISKPIMDEEIFNVVDDINMSQYSIRNLKLDLSKEALNYLLEEKADYLLIDPNDCRMEIVELNELENNNAYTISSAGGELYEKLKNSNKMRRLNAGQIPFEKYEQAARMVCARIRQVYEPSEIIIHVHKFVGEYTDGNKILIFNNEKFLARNKACRDIMDKMYSILQKEFESCHVIEFPDYVLGDSRHKFGVCGLHYHQLYDEYGKEAIKIICEGHADEKFLLSTLRDKYSLKFQLLRDEIENKYRFRILETRLNELVYSVSRKNKLEDLKSIFNNITDIKVYLDVINLYKYDIGVLVSVKDTPGSNRISNCLERIQEFGFKNYPSNLWFTYCGFIMKGVVIVDTSSSKAEIPTTWNGQIHNHSISLESHSWRKLNMSKIMIDDKDYSTNQRGANIVIVNADTFEVLDSVVYDMHEVQDYFRRIKEL